ncbi:MAG: TlpA disulfide reductase family protein [Bacteroidota bacterium]
MNTTIIYPILKISLFFAVFGLSLSQTACTSSMANDHQNAAFLNKSMPTFALENYAGESINSDDYKGKHIVIHIATTWCPFCNAEAPHLEKLSQDYKDKNVEVLIIDVKEDRDLVKKLLIDRFDLTFPVLFDTDGSVAASFAPDDVLPDLARDEVMLASNMIIDPNGKIVFFSLLDTNNFDAKLVELKAALDERL